MKQYMLIFSLGSVQTFIEQARKTRDLWLGSFLLAKLMEAAMQEVEDAQSAKPFVFPTNRKLDKEDRHATLSHKYVAIFDSFADAQAAVDQSKLGMKKFWDGLSNDVRQAVIPNEYRNNKTFKDMWDSQSDLYTCFETFWVIVENETDDYADWLGRAGRALEARKRLKDFQFREEPGEKSTISGERQALPGMVDGHPATREQTREFWVRVARRRSAKEISNDGSERLDAVDTIKRFATESDLIIPKTFPSTSSVATATFVERLLEDLKADQLDEWRKATDSDRISDSSSPDVIPYLENLAGTVEKKRDVLRRDGDCYFKETFTARRLERDYAILKDAPGIADKGRKGLQDLFAATDKELIRRPTPYYAVLKMDGDHMGDLLRTVAVNQERHVNLSKALSSFAHEKAPILIEKEYPARLVYAGGDDVLALAPLARDLSEGERKKQGIIYTLLDLVDQLRHRFDDEIKDKVPDFTDPVAASMGIAIAHHYTPLSAVLRATRDAEELAKNRYNRNALVVTIMRRSGEQTRVGCHWQYKDEGGKDLEPEGQPILLFSKFYDLFDLDILSPKCIFTLLEEAPTLVSLEFNGEREEPPEEIERLRRAAQASEIKRVLRRQRNEKLKDRLPDKETEQLANRLVQLAAAMDREHTGKKSVYLQEDELRYGLVEVLGWLLVMAFLTRKEQD